MSVPNKPLVPTRTGEAPVLAARGGVGWPPSLCDSAQEIHDCRGRLRRSDSLKILCAQALTALGDLLFV